jgi:polyphosphate glucokinase
MDQMRTLAVDIGGTGLKLALLDSDGKMLGERVRVPTPQKPVSPQILVDALKNAAAQLSSGFDRVSCGFPGAVRNGRVLTAPNLGTELWAGFDLQGALGKLWDKPVRVMNDADVLGFGVIKGSGVEMMLTLGTGAGTAIYDNGRIVPHLELSHHPIHGKSDYDRYVGRDALKKKGRKAWNKRVERVIEILRTVVNFDHLYLGGGNAKYVDFELPGDVSIVTNNDGLAGGIALWGAEEIAGANAAAAAAKAKRGGAEAKRQTAPVAVTSAG